MSTAQAEKAVIEVLKANAGKMAAPALSASLQKKSVSAARRREALLRLATQQKVKVASGRVELLK